MRSHIRLMRYGMWLATTSLSLTASLPAMAQPAPPAGAEQSDAGQAGDGQPDAGQAGDANTDPPALAGRVATLTGAVSFHSAGETQWSPATLNYPVTNGEAFWTEPAAQASLEVADDRVVLASSTELDVTALDQAQFTMTAAQGAMFLQLNSLPQGQNVTINTPRGAVQITAAGRYEVVAGDTDDATLVTVIEGAAHVAGNNLALDVGPQQTATIGGTDTLQGSVGAIQTDAFLQGLLRAPARRAFAANVPRQVQYMTGAQDLQTYGSFSQTQQYGQVWYPQSVPANWAPYRDGHWSYVHPWGWTWVDNSRWGFAPFHYGRWVQVENRWGWVPGEAQASVDEGSPYPVYSPALVTFLNVGGAALAGASINFGGGYAPAWIPLGPREPYYPWYHCQPSYFSRLNTPYGVPETIIRRGPTYINNTTINNRNVFINERAATVVPRDAFTAGRPIQAVYRPLPASALVNARPFVGRLAVAPTALTPNLPRGTARRFNIAAPAAPLRVMAGPRIVPEADLRRGAPPALRRAALPPSVRAVPVGEVGHGMRGAAPGGVVPPRDGEGRPGQPGLRGQEPRPGEPAAGPRAPGGLPVLRSPGSGRPDPRLLGRPDQQAGRPDLHGPGEAAHPQPGIAPQAARPGAEPRQEPRGAAPNETRGGVVPQPRGQEGRPGEAVRPEAGGPPRAARPNETEPRAARPTETEPRAVRPNAVEPRAVVPPARIEARPGEPGSGRAETPRPAPAPHAEAPRPAPRVEAPRPPARPEPPRPAPRPEPRAEAPRPVAPRPAPAPRPEAPRPAPAPRPEPRAEAPRPVAPRPMAPRPEAPRPEAPRPAPAPRPEPRAEAPRPVAPHPAPAPRPEPPHPQAPARDRKEPPK